MHSSVSFVFQFRASRDQNRSPGICRPETNLCKPTRIYMQCPITSHLLMLWPCYGKGKEDLAPGLRLGNCWGRGDTPKGSPVMGNVERSSRKCGSLSMEFENWWSSQNTLMISHLFSLKQSVHERSFSNSVPSPLTLQDKVE